MVGEGVYPRMQPLLQHQTLDFERFHYIELQFDGWHALAGLGNQVVHSEIFLRQQCVRHGYPQFAGNFSPEHIDLAYKLLAIREQCLCGGIHFVPFISEQEAGPSATAQFHAKPGFEISHLGADG